MKNEIEQRLKRFRERLAANGVDGAILLQKTDLYYLSGTDQDAHLWVSAHEPPFLMVRKSLERAREDASIEEIDPKNFDGVVIPGGFAPDILRRYEGIVKFIKHLHDDGKVVAAICHGGWLLVSADIVKGRQVTCFFAIKDDLIAAGADYVNKEVVVDGNIITSRKPEDLPAFTIEIIKQLKE